MADVSEIILFSRIDRHMFLSEYIVTDNCSVDILKEVITVNNYFSDGGFFVETLKTGVSCVVNSRGAAVVAIAGHTLFNYKICIKIVDILGGKYD